MKLQPYFKEIRTLIAQFADAFNDVIINRYNNTDTIEDKIHVNYYYAPKQRVLQDLVNKTQAIQIPCISMQINSVQRDINRVFNKIQGPLYSLTTPQSSFEQPLQPVPVNIGVNVSIITRFQADLDQILSNFIPYCDPYIVVSWKMPSTNLEIRSHIQWSGSININQPVDISHSQAYRHIADTQFTIEGWLFKQPKGPVGKIYYIDTSFTSVCSINDYDILKTLEDEWNTETFIISARPQVTECNPYITITNTPNVEFILNGKMFDYVTNLYVSGSPLVFEILASGLPLSASYDKYVAYHDPFVSTKLSGMYPGFSGIELSAWNIVNDHMINFTMPSALSVGYIDVIALNEAGYGKLTIDAWRPTLNPYPSSLPDYYTYEQWQHPSVSGIKIYNL